ncbi:DNA primase [Escherichia phage bV_EcoS_AHP24]|uniref:DNA primase n=2 Tax=Escherichia phage vB_EcoS_AHS24 TaxID=1416030 RepID=A0A067YXQ9_9CAUD|nr:DNA primase [Escherichia phage vB_EcoS_AHS24]AHI60503.1 DNA primase [Escherichia phage bV_EcoS_AHP24]AHI60659.1 DNA primase [Escherichia phage vB_EcoS_AHS24]
MNYDKNEVIPKMAGLWKSFYAKELGWNDRHLSKKHGPCPYCFGTDRFRFTDEIGSEKGNGAAVCSKCGSDSGIGWVMKCSGLRFAEAINLLGDWLNLTPVEIIVKANKAASRVQRYNFGAQASIESIEKVMSRTKSVEMTQLTRFEAIITEREYKIGIKGSGEEIIAEQCFMVYEDGLSDEPCNVKFIDEEGNESYLAKDYTRGSVVPVSKCSDGAIYLTVGWINALHVSACTKRTTYDCLTHHNLEMVAYELRNKECRIACLADEKESLYVADDRGLKVVIPKGGNFKMGLERRLYNPQDLIDKHS